MGAEGTQGRASKQVRSGFPGKGMLALSVEGGPSGVGGRGMT